MIYPAPDKLDNVGSKYALVIVAAKRAKQLRDGARRLVDTTSTNSLTIALEELAESRLTMLQVGEPEALPRGPAPTPVLGGLVATSLDSDIAAERYSKAEDLLPLPLLIDDADDDAGEPAQEEEEDEAPILADDDTDADAVVPRLAADPVIAVAPAEEEAEAAVLGGDEPEDDVDAETEDE